MRSDNGYTLIEVVIVIVIMGIIAAIAMNSLSSATETARFEETKEELRLLGYAIAGNPNLVSGGMRTDFGYAGDVGALPPDLDALISNPGGYSTWNGPYIQDEFSDGTGNTEFKLDAWGAQYNYSAGNSISSSGGGSALTYNYVNSANDLLYNTVTVSVNDLNFSPPGTVYRDSIQVCLTYPSGSGALTTVIKNPNSNGMTIYDSIPIGIHTVQVIYIPASDTLTRIVSVNPGRDSHTQVQHFADAW